MAFQTTVIYDHTTASVIGKPGITSSSVEDKLVVNGCLLLCNNTKDVTGSIAAAS